MKFTLRRDRIRSIVGIATAAAVSAALIQGAPAVAADRPSAPEWVKAVDGSGAREVASKAGVPPVSAPIVSADLPSGSFEVATDGQAAGSSEAVTSGDGAKATVVDGEWHELGWTGVRIASAGDPVAVKDAKSQLSSSKKGTAKAKAKDRAARVSATFVDRERAKKLGVAGPVLELKRADKKSARAAVGVRIPKKLLDSAFGADYSSRVRWVQVDAKKAPSSAKELASAATPVASQPAANGADLVITPMLRDAPVMVMAMAAPAGGSGTGDFTATSLKPSAAWDVSAQTGTFSWQYPLRVPPAAAGPTPELSLSYDSQSVDGLTGSTNNQPSAIGEGWSLAGSGFIERSYVGCAVDDGPSGPVKTSGDLCWKNANATVSFAGHSGELIQIAGTNQYRLSNDDGTRFTEFKGAPCAANGTSDTACWQMITTDGTQYLFGLNQLPGYSAGKPTTNSAWTVPVFGNDVGEPCHASTFAASSCDRAWRWNLDYVLDAHGNSQAFYYNAQTNRYAKNGTTGTAYVRGGELARVEYGLTQSNVFGANAASGKVLFSYDKNGRCSDAGGGKCTAQPGSGDAAKPANAAAYPDVPFDQLCTSGGCAAQISPTFWSTSKLASVKTQVLTGGAYKDVDSWALKQSFPEPGDGTSAALWLDSVTHTGYSGSTSLTEPAVTFAGTPMQNRVWAVDGLAPLDKWRIASIKTELGGTVSVNYSGQQCVPGDRTAIFAAPQNNLKRCFPQWWSPQVTPPQAPQQDLFHKYVVTGVIDNPNTEGAGAAAIEKQYVYGSPAWRYNDSPLTPADKRTWSIFAGYDTTEVRIGSADKPADQQVTKYTFFRGLNGDRAAPAGGTKQVLVGGIPDERPYAGRVRQEVSMLGVGGAVLSTTDTTPWASAGTANNGYHAAWFTGDATVVVTEPVSTGGNRTVTTTRTFDASTGLIRSEQAVPSDAAGTCTSTAYAAPNPTLNMIGAVAEVRTTAGTCAQAESAGADRLLSNVRTSYDGGAFGAAPTKGDATKTEVVTAVTGATKTWSTASTTKFDALGRPLEVTDALARVTKTAYTPAGPTGPTTAVETTNPVGWTTKTVLDPSRATVLSTTDVNGKVTTASYDALGRRTAVWLPNRPQSEYASSPSTSFAYSVSQTQASSVTTGTLVNAYTQESIDLIDGLGRVVQTQAKAVGSGAVVSDNVYDSLGRTVTTTKPYWANTTASTKLFVATSMSQVPSRTDTKYDAAGRTVASILYTYGNEMFRTGYTYKGSDRVDVTPPSGGTPTTTITDSRGQKSALTQYQAATPSGAGVTTRYEYNPAGAMTAMTDPVGNKWSWQYDLLGNQVIADDPDSGRTTSTYDLLGNVTSTTDARGQVLAYSYDQLNRKTGKYSGSTSGPLLASWRFDTLAKGKPTSSTSYTGSTPGKPGLAHTSTVGGYDDLYNATSTTVSIPQGAPAFGGTDYKVSYTFTESGLPAQTVLPAIAGVPAERLNHVYDGVGNPAGLTGTTSYVTAYYSPTSELTFLVRGASGNTLDTGYGYNPGTGQVNQVIDTSYTDDWATEANRMITRNDAGGITKIATSSERAATDTQCFGYDGLQQLTEAWTPANGDCGKTPTVAGLGGPAPYWTSYTVDAATGNRLSTTSHAKTGDTTAKYAYPAAGAARPHAATTVGTGQFSYDPTGNTLTRPGQTLSWDESGKLSTVTAGGATQSRVYDADGNVLLQTDPKTGTKLFLGGTEVTLASGASAASAVRTYTFAGQPVAERTSKAGVSGTKVTWLAGDLNSTQDVAVGQSTGEVTRRYADPYGNPRGAKTEWVSGHSYLNAPESSVTGLTQLGARAYDPVLGKFLSVDPVLAPDNPVQNNGYAYSHNNPVTTSDPSGLIPLGRPKLVPPSAVYKDDGPIAPPPTSAAGGTSGGGPYEKSSPKASGSSGTSSSKGSKPKQPNSVMEVAKWVTNSDLGQTLMMGCGFIPILGSLCAGAESAAYAAQGRWGEAAISAAGIAAGFVVGAGAAVGAAKLAVKLSARVAKSAEKTADVARASGRKTGAAAELRVGRRVFTDTSTGGAERTLHLDVGRALEAVPEGQRAPWHGACAEMGCLSQAAYAGVDPAGGSIRAVAIGSSNPGHGLPKMICSSCSAVLDQFGVSR